MNTNVTIKITKVPGVPREVTVAKGAILADALSVYASEYGEAIDGYEVRRGDDVVSATTYVPYEGDRIFLVEQIKGNC